MDKNRRFSRLQKSHRIIKNSNILDKNILTQAILMAEVASESEISKPATSQTPSLIPIPIFQSSSGSTHVNPTTISSENVFSSGIHLQVTVPSTINKLIYGNYQRPSLDQLPALSMAQIGFPVSNGIWNPGTGTVQAPTITQVSIFQSSSGSTSTNTTTSSSAYPFSDPDLRVTLHKNINKQLYGKRNPPRQEQFPNYSIKTNEQTSGVGILSRSGVSQTYPNPESTAGAGGVIEINPDVSAVLNWQPKPKSGPGHKLDLPMLQRTSHIQLDPMDLNNLRPTVIVYNEKKMRQDRALREKVYRCPNPKCRMPFRSEHEVRGHLRISPRKKLLICKMCRVAFRKEHQFVQHNQSPEHSKCVGHWTTGWRGPPGSESEDENETKPN